MVVGAGGGRRWPRRCRTRRRLRSRVPPGRRPPLGAVAHIEHGVIESAYGSHGVRNPLSRSTIPGNTSTNRSTSTGSVDQPTDTRNDRSASTPIASNTETARASPTSTTIPNVRPRRADRVRAGSARPRRPPLRGTRRWGAVRGPRAVEALDAVDQIGHAAAVEVSAACAPISAARSVAAHAAPKPTHAGTSSMPATPRRAPRAADEQADEKRSPRRTSSAPARRAAQLVRSERAQVDVVREVDREMPGGRGRVDVHDAPATRAILADLARRLRGAHLVVRELDPDESVSGRTAAITSAASKRPVRSTPTTVTSSAPAGAASRTLECSTAWSRRDRDGRALRRSRC